MQATPEAVRAEILAKIGKIEDKLDSLSERIGRNITDIALLKLKVTFIALGASALAQWVGKVFF